jgi:drug/metabolite transporter (DMT)-like permease
MSKSDKHIDRTSFIILFVLSVIWGCSFILIKKALLAFHPVQAASMRLGVSALTFLPILIYHRKDIDFSKWFKFLLVGLTGSGIPAFMFSIAQTKLASSVSGMLNSLTPIWTLIVGFLIFKIEFSRTKLIGVFIGFLGALSLIIFNSDTSGTNDNLWYASLVVIATLCYGTSVNMVQAFFKGTKPIIISAMSFFLTGVPAVIYLIVSNIGHTITTHPQGYYSLGAVTLLSIFGTVIASILFYYLVQKTSAIFASTVTYMMPFMAILVGVLDGEPFLFVHLIGMALILVGVYLSKK